MKNGHVRAVFTFPDTFLETGDLILFPSAPSKQRSAEAETCERASALVGQTRRSREPTEQFLEPRLTQCCRKWWLSPALSSSDSSLVSQSQVSAKPRFQIAIVPFWFSRLIFFPAQDADVEMKEQQKTVIWCKISYLLLLNLYRSMWMDKIF